MRGVRLSPRGVTSGPSHLLESSDPPRFGLPRPFAWVIVYAPAGVSSSSRTCVRLLSTESRKTPSYPPARVGSTKLSGRGRSVGADETHTTTQHRDGTHGTHGSSSRSQQGARSRARSDRSAVRQGLRHAPRR